ncbi:L-threonate dehydrogenase [Polymorphum gilvum]|uniref:L-threonate dehydrogenase n=1 Tax=Polymorphum gilvum (strain LMG 25793 / CGMCC 1.9160 / SL003B-26A1) TaxID=991905 RepID=F2IZK4_POLGS|nr:L-threonate dehydrogenase [Polymorphum gilvum]ADZ69561.1 Predicted dehydrogenase, with NAD(P)-binding Rossmann-fold domain [Polymorphum gilvum SL003B-26A1]
MTSPSTDGIVLFGLGAMGLGIAQSLRRAGLAIRGVDRDAQRMAAFAAEGGAIAASAADLAAALAGAGIVVTVVVNAEQTEDVLFGADDIAGRLRPGAVVISCATVAPERAVEFETRLAARGVLYLDAPISGGAARAASGQLSVMASGTPEAFARARPALDAMAETVFDLGDRAGPGSAMKVVNQLLAGVHIVAAAEALAFGIGQGIPAGQMVDVISRCAGTSWMFENRGRFIADGDYRPHSAVDIFVKDLGIVRDTAAGGGLSVPLAEAALARFEAAREAGLGREGDAAVVKIYAREGRIPLPGEPDETFGKKV